jgi:hypothetical protein
LSAWNFDKVFEGLRDEVQSPHFVDWTGCIYPLDSFPKLPEPVLRFNEPNLIGDGFRAGPNEWAAFGFACQLAKSVKAPRSLLIEFGSSQGLWCLPWTRFFANRAQDLSSKAIAFEASNSSSQSLDFWREQKLDFNANPLGSGFILVGRNWEFEWIHGAIDSKSGTLSFPNIDVRSNNGSRILPAEVSQNSNGNEYITVDAYSPSKVLSLLEDDDVLQLLHIDIQGVEAELLKQEDFYELVQRAQVLVLGTHSTESEQLAISNLDRIGYRLVGASPSKYQYEDKPILIEDGEQVWLHPAAYEFGVENGFFEKVGLGHVLSIERDMVISERDRFGLAVTDLGAKINELDFSNSSTSTPPYIDELLGSWSWKLTLPLRIVHQSVKRLYKLFVGQKSS